MSSRSLLLGLLLAVACTITLAASRSVSGNLGLPGMLIYVQFYGGLNSNGRIYIAFHLAEGQVLPPNTLVALRQSEDRKYKAFAKPDGTFKIYNVEEGTYFVEVEAIGYEFLAVRLLCCFFSFLLAVVNKQTLINTCRSKLKFLVTLISRYLVLIYQMQRLIFHILCKSPLLSRRSAITSRDSHSTSLLG